MSIQRTAWNSLIVGAVCAMLFTSGVFAATVEIDFESSSNPSAVVGAEATDLYLDLGVRFPSEPTIEIDGANQVLQQGSTDGRPDPLPDRVTCAPLEMEFSETMGVREVRMRVINRHLRSYSVQAFAGAVEIDADIFTSSFTGGPPFPPILPYRDITLRTSSDEGAITRVVANPPSDCFDLMVIDNLLLETENEPNRFSLLAYEVTQGIMSRLTRPSDLTETIPDTRLMALPGRRLIFVAGRDTGVRFFIGASERDEPDYNGVLDVTVTYRDGFTRTKRLTENTEGGRIAAHTPLDITPDTLRRTLVQRRARVDQSLDYVIPGRFLENAERMQLQLLAGPGETLLARVRVDFTGPYRMGLNVARVNGVGRDAIVGAAPLRSVTSLAVQFLEDLYPIAGSVVLRESGVLVMNSGAVANCNAFLAALDAQIAGTTASAPISGVNYWTNLYIAQNPPGCGGLAWYNTPGALSNQSFSTVAHEISHNIGINHASNQHNESLGGTRRDWESWPYTHGSIGAVDETMNFNDGVFGAVLNPNAASVGLDFVENWGVWIFGVIPPCDGVGSALLPTCTAPDTSIAHDYMSYGPTTAIPIWGQENWISDINFFRIQRWFQDCTALDPPHRFQTGLTTSFTDTSGECNGAGRPVTGALSAALAGSTPQDALVFSGLIEEDDAVHTFRTIRKLATAQSFATPPGAYSLIMRAEDGAVIRTISFSGRVASGGSEEARAFVVVAPYEGKLARVDIELDQNTIFSRDISGLAPSIMLVNPKGGEVWRDGKHRIEWKLDRSDDETEVYIQYSPDRGASWLP